MTAPTKPPTAGEIARARRVVSEIRWIAIPTAIERAAETLLAALDAAEREVKRLTDRQDEIARMIRVCDGGQYRADWESAIQRLVRERDEANARLDVARGALHTALRERDAARAALVRDDAETLEVIEFALRAGRKIDTMSEWAAERIRSDADAVLAALRERGR